MAAVAGKFGLLQQNGLNYAYHIDATRYARYLRRLAEKSGARRIEGKIIQVKQTQDGDIASLHLDNGQTVQLKHCCEAHSTSRAFRPVVGTRPTGRFKIAGR